MNSTKIKNFKISEGLAELYGAMIGDGCLSHYFSNCDKKDKFCFLITGHTHDEPYFRTIIQPILFKEFGIKGCIRFKKKDNVTRFETLSKRVFSFFEKLGFPVGLKGNLDIPNEILSDNQLALACVRGIFDTDGSIYSRYSKQYPSHRKKYNYKNIEFKMNSQNVIFRIKEVLDSNGIKTTNIRKNRKAHVLNIINQQSVNLFFKLVNPSNPYHKERFLNLK